MEQLPSNDRSENDVFAISDLPDRLLARTFSFLDGKSRMQSELVCRKWMEIITFSDLEIMPRVDIKSIMISLDDSVTYPTGYYRGSMLLHIHITGDRSNDNDEDLAENILRKVNSSCILEIRGSKVPLPFNFLGLLTFSHVYMVSLIGVNLSQATDDDIAGLCGLKHLTDLDFEGCVNCGCISDTAIQLVAQCSKSTLCSIKVSFCQGVRLSDAVFVFLSACSKLSAVMFSGCKNMFSVQGVRDLVHSYVHGNRKLDLHLELCGLNVRSFQDVFGSEISDIWGRQLHIGNVTLFF